MVVAGESGWVSELRQQWRDTAVAELNKRDFAQFVSRRALVGVLARAGSWDAQHLPGW